MQNNTGLLTLIFMLLAHYSFSQDADSTTSPTHFSGSVSVTNNGISIVPSFSLEKPAVILNLSVGKSRLSFEPDIRFSLAGRPWTMLFWGRYKLINKEKFQLSAGTHLGLNFITSLLPVKGDTALTTVTRPYLAGELFPRFSVTKNIRLGIYSSGGLAPYVIETLKNIPDVHLTLLARNKSRIANAANNSTVVDADIMDYAKLKNAITGQDIVYVNLAGDLDAMAKNIVKAMKEAEVKRIIAISSIGIYETPLKSVLLPYRKLADVIEISGLDYTILRPGWFTNADKVD